MRLFLSFLCSFAFVLQVLVIAGCSGSTANKANNNPASGGGSGSGTLPIICASDNPIRDVGERNGDNNNQNGSVSGIWLQTPAPGANPSNVTVNSTAFATATITQWTVCLDGQAVYQANNAANSISQAINIPTGRYLLWASEDSKNDFDRSEIRLIQVGPPPTSRTVLPTPPANAKVLTEMQNVQSNWSICSLCAAGRMTPTFTR